MTSEKRAQKFHRYWWRLTTQIWIVLLILLKQIFSQSDALFRSGWYRVITIEFLRPFLRRHFVGKPVEASRNVGYFLRLNTIWLWMKFKTISNGEIFEWIIMKIHISNGRVKKEIMTSPINLPFSRSSTLFPWFFHKRSCSRAVSKSGFPLSRNFTCLRK